MEHFELITQSKIRDIKQLHDAFRKKEALEKQIAKMIKDWEDDTGLAIDTVRYQRDITLPIRSPRYTDLTIVISTDEL